MFLNYIRVLRSQDLTLTRRCITLLDMTMTRKRPNRPKVAADTLAARLILLRHELGWSQREAAEATGVPYGTWQGMESGRETRGMDRHIVKIAAASGYDRDWLMWGGPLHPPEVPPRPLRRVRREGIEPPTRWFRGNDPTRAGNDLAKAA